MCKRKKPLNCAPFQHYSPSLVLVSEVTVTKFPYRSPPGNKFSPLWPKQSGHFSLFDSTTPTKTKAAKNEKKMITKFLK